MTSSQIKMKEGFGFDALSSKINRVLISVTDLELNGKDADQISVQDILGNFDAWGYLILFISLMGVLAMTLLSAIWFLTIWSESLLFIYPAAVIGLASGILLFYCLFRIRRWLKS